MIETTTQFVAAGGNRHPSAADWEDDILVFGAGNNVAIWNTSIGSVTSLLQSHTDTVTGIKITTLSKGRVIISGSSDRTIRLWRQIGEQFEFWQTIEAHEAAVNAVAVHGNLIVSGAADGTVKIWRIEDQVKLIQTVSLKPRFLALALAITSLDESLCLAVAGTTTSIQLFTSNGNEFTLQATLTGHDGWIRSLDFTHAGQDVLLASASQDKLIRLWRFTVNTSESQESLLSNKLYQLQLSNRTWTAQYDALLVGHEDWIYTVRWSQSQQLLSASADNSLAIWKYESNLWICDVRLGEISAEKGATTATGSTGGFWIGLWGTDDKSVVSLGRTGSWRRWSLTDNGWEQELGVSGHVKEVQSLSWARDGSYLLSTSLDQTTRLWAPWTGSWHEFSRPQIHGYDLNCLATLPQNQFVSGAEEKLLRVFNQPQSVGDLLSGKSVSLSNATIPMLGLSNKATTDEEVDTAQIVGAPFEDHLARFTLWPEHEKLYGHGYEISAVAANNAGTLIATSCKASSLDHAVIRLYETKTWREIRPPLSAHTLTVTGLAFSPDDKYLLSVGRDRQWALFRRSDDSVFELAISNPAGHSRMVLGCSWAPSQASDADHVFATAGRDKTVKIWKIKRSGADQIASFSSTSAITTVAFAPSGYRLAYGNEAGQVVVLQTVDEHWQDCSTTEVTRASRSITSLAWRPGEELNMLAIASEDTSVRLLVIR